MKKKVLVYEWKNGRPKKWIDLEKFGNGVYWTIMVILGLVAISLWVKVVMIWL